MIDHCQKKNKINTRNQDSSVICDAIKTFVSQCIRGSFLNFHRPWFWRADRSASVWFFISWCDEMSDCETFASVRCSRHAGTCKRQINPGDGQRDKSCVSKEILSVTYSNKQNPRSLFPLSAVRSVFFFVFFYISEL